MDYFSSFSLPKLYNIHSSLSHHTEYEINTTLPLKPFTCYMHVKAFLQELLFLAPELFLLGIDISRSFSSTHTNFPLINSGTSVYQEKLHADSLPTSLGNVPLILIHREVNFFINLFKYAEHVKCIRINMDIINVIFIYFPASYKLDVEA